MASFHKPARYCQSSDPLGNMEQQSARAIRYQPSALDQKFGERPVSGSAQNLEINMTAGVLKNLDTGEQHQCETIGEYAMSILEAGGIKPLFIKRIKEEGHDS